MLLPLFALAWLELFGQLASVELGFLVPSKCSILVGPARQQSGEWTPLAAGSACPLGFEPAETSRLVSFYPTASLLSVAPSPSGSAALFSRGVSAFLLGFLAIFFFAGPYNQVRTCSATAFSRSSPIRSR